MTCPDEVAQIERKEILFTGRAARSNMLQKRQSVVWHPGVRACWRHNPNLMCVVVFEEWCRPATHIMFGVVSLPACDVDYTHTVDAHLFVRVIDNMTLPYCPILVCHMGCGVM